jgi:MOSC domain-containing protein YiiM
MAMIVQGVNVPRPAAAGEASGAAGAWPRLVPATGPVEVGLSGLGGEDLRERDYAALFVDDPDEHHISHALYAYPTVHHAFWRTVRAQARVTAFGEVDAPLPPALFDEHLALDGIQESQLWVGDVLRFPGCELVVTAPRLPDARFNVTLGFPKAAKMVAESRWCGFWLAVRLQGRIAAGEPFQVVPGPRATGIVELFRERTQGRAY